MIACRCFDCRFFATLDEDIPADDLTPAQQDECLQGRCRRNPPTIGHFRGEDEDMEYDYGQWPLVLSGDWCGAFEPCQRAIQSEAQAHHICEGDGSENNIPFPSRHE